jgi:hypothetical protein
MAEFLSVWIKPPYRNEREFIWYAGIISRLNCSRKEYYYNFYR